MTTSSRRVCILLGFSLLLVPAPAPAGEIVLPAPALDREARIQARYRIDAPVTGRGTLTVTWTDVYDRLVEQRTIPVDLRGGAEVAFPLDLRRAVAMQNRLSVRLSLGADPKRARGPHGEQAATSFIARPTSQGWWDYQIIMWQPHTAEQYATLKKIGVTAGAVVYRNSGQAPPDALLQNDLRWYVENIATDFYSAYHRLLPDRPKNWKFLEAKRLHEKDPAGKEAFKRDPSLSDPEWLTVIGERLAAAARSNAPYRPLFYNLGDEPGIADLSAFWDFDYSSHSLAGFRAWLAGRYGTLAALNRQWGSSFGSWDAVMPDGTTEAMQRADQNFSAWSDFKEWMDVAFARALQVGTDAVHAVDPAAYVAIEGAQQPGWGGYDYARLSAVLDLIEPYNIGGNVELIRSLNPRTIILTTAGAQGPREKHRVWRELLHGSRGLILWDARSEFVRPDGRLGPRGLDAEPYFTEIRRGTGALVINSERPPAPIAVLYSPRSLRLEWMDEQRPKGEAWTKRSASSDEYGPLRWRRESLGRLLEDLGRPYRFVTSEEIERGDLTGQGYRVLVLSHALSLTDREAQALRTFVEQGGVLIADGPPGVYDERGRRLPEPRLSDFFGPPITGQITERRFGRGRTIYLNVDMTRYARDRLLTSEPDLHRIVGRLLESTLGVSEFRVTDPSGRPVIGVEIQAFRNGAVTMLAIQSNPELALADMSSADGASNKRFEAPLSLTVTWSGERFVSNVRAAKALGKRTRLSFDLDPHEPTLLMLSPQPLPAVTVAGPRQLRRGDVGVYRLSLDGSPAALHVLRVDVVDPSGRRAPQYSGNLMAPRGRARLTLPLALNDPAGRWKLQVSDVMSGQSRVSVIDVPAQADTR